MFLKKEKKSIILPETVKESYVFTYRLQYDEAFETFRMLSEKFSTGVRLGVSAALSIIAAVMLILFFLDSRKAHLFLLAVVAILLLSYIVYVPWLRAKKGAKRVASQGGVYKVQLTAAGQILLPGAAALDVAGDKDARAYETGALFAIRTDSSNTFCIPKRIMKEDEIRGVREILRAYTKLIER